jgi:ribosome-binding ATPase
MSLSIGIVGLANVGKSTLFNALLKKQQALAANYPFATIEPNVGIVPVPDHRLQQLAETIAKARMHVGEVGRLKEQLTYTQLPPIVPATVKFVDIAGLVKGASEGEGLGNKFLAHIREVDVICHVVRAFDNEDVARAGSIDPESDYQIVRTELELADLQTRDKRAAKKKTETEVVLPLLTAKPEIMVFNVDEGKLKQLPNDGRFYLCAKMESELAALNQAEQAEYLAQYGLKESGLERLIKAGYERLKLQSFLTAGEIECRAWAIKQGTTAVEASGVIHTDFMKNFIKADVIDWQEFVRLGGWKRARAAGAVRSEGRDYVMGEGDVVEFRIGA